MITIRKAADRGHFNHGWLDTYHTFSFADYYDLRHMNFRGLRVINEDTVAPGEGFGMHGHKDMEIVTCVLEGALEHRDSLGNGEVLRPGEMQRMSAGTGIRHSEFNPSSDTPVHLYQIWLEPSRKGLTPGYEQKAFNADGKHNQWRTVVAPDGREGALKIQTDASIALATLDKGAALEYALQPGRAAWVQVLRGKVEVNGHRLSTSDAVGVENESRLSVKSDDGAEVMLFDLA